MTTLNDLSRKFVLETRERSPDGSGGYHVRWRGLGVIWASVKARSSRQDFIAGEARPRVLYRFTVRASPVGSPSRPTPDQRLRENDRIFRILTVSEADRAGQYLELSVEEGVLP